MTINKKKLFFGVIVIILLALIVFWLVSYERPIPETLCFQNNCFSLEIADTPEKRAQGLMFREELPEGQGMLFVFEREGVYKFWMKDTLIPLDIIWLDSEGEVVFIKDSAQPCGPDVCEYINPEKQAKYVLELKAGTAEGLGLKPGDKFSFEL